MLEQLVYTVESGLADLGRRLLRPSRANSCRTTSTA